MRKLFILILSIPIVLVLVGAINDPNPNPRTVLTAPSAFTKNYDGIDNFLFQFTNTIRGWVGKSYDDYNRYYMMEEIAKKHWYILGKYVPYFFLFMIVILFKYELQKKQVE